MTASRPGGGEGEGGKPSRRGAKSRAVPKAAVRGRPPRLAHLLPARDGRHDRAPAATLSGGVGPERSRAGTDVRVPGYSDAVAGSADTLCLPNPEWLPHVLTVVGPAEKLRAFQDAARGPGVIPWRRDYGRLEEDWVHTLLAQASTERGLSVQSARIVAGQMREVVEALEMRAADCEDRVACPLDLNALIAVPDHLLRLGPEDPDVVDWLWLNWGTTWMLRGVGEAAVGAEVLIPAGEDALCYRFWSADWTPWRALAAATARWPALTLHVKVLAVTE